LTIDLGAGDQFLTDLSRYATANWLNDASPVLDLQPSSASAAESNWQQHITGKANYAPPVPPLAPNRLTGSLYIVTGHNPAPECNNFSSSLENSTGSYVQTVPPAGAGTTNGMLGLMFWAAECQGTHSICTTPPNTCEERGWARARERIVFRCRCRRFGSSSCSILRGSGRGRSLFFSLFLRAQALGVQVFLAVADLSSANLRKPYENLNRR
jgi:hypothetical protein